MYGIDHGGPIVTHALNTQVRAPRRLKPKPQACQGFYHISQKEYRRGNVFKGGHVSIRRGPPEQDIGGKAFLRMAAIISIRITRRYTSKGNWSG